MISFLKPVFFKERLQANVQQPTSEYFKGKWFRKLAEDLQVCGKANVYSEAKSTSATGSLRAS